MRVMKKRKLRSAVTEALNHWTTGCLFPTLIYVLVPQQQNFTMGSLAQISSGAIRCSFNTRFRTRSRRVLVQIPREVPEGSSWGSGGFLWRPAEAPEGSVRFPGGFPCRYLVRFRKFPVQVLGEVPERYGADTWLGSRGFWCRYLVRFRKFPVQLPNVFGLGEDAWWGSGGFWCRYLVRFRKVPVQLPDVFGLGEDAWWGSGGFWCR